MTSNEKYELLLKLQKIDKVIDKINEKWKRKRLINISYVIKRVLRMNAQKFRAKVGHSQTTNLPSFLLYREI